ncbi:MAG: aminoacyl-tRNA hydrolase [Fimbriiglobus sp.]
MKLLVGLGNPGAKYQGTRHNVGFDTVDYLAADPSCGPFRSKFQSLVADLKIGDEPCLLVKPQTFMNLSGRAVREILDFYKLQASELFVIVDDFNLPLGKLRVRGQGSHGGQNGLRNIQECLGSDAYPRLRIGVGQPGSGEAVDFVLSKFKPGERDKVEEAVAKAGQSAILWVREGLEACMNRTNADEPKPKPPKPNNQDGKKTEKAEKPQKTKEKPSPASEQDTEKK